MCAYGVSNVTGTMGTSVVMCGCEYTASRGEQEILEKSKLQLPRYFTTPNLELTTVDNIHNCKYCHSPVCKDDRLLNSQHLSVY